MRNTLFLATDGAALLRSVALLVRWSRGHVEPVVPPPFPVHLLAQQALAIVLQEGGAGSHTWGEWLGTPCVLGADVGELQEEVTAHLLGDGYLVEDGGLLGLGPRAEGEFGRRHFLELMAVFTSPPLFTVLDGRREIGQVSEKVITVSSNGVLRPFLLAGRTWQAVEIDWRARVVRAEAAVGHGVAQWDGSGAALGADLARGVRSVLAGAEPDGVQLSRRAVEQLAVLRAERPWVQEGSTVLRRGEDGRLYWWTFAGDVANWWLAGALEPYRHGRPGPDAFRVELDGDAPLDEVREFLRGLRGGDLRLGVGVRAGSPKFAELVPEQLADDMMTRRLSRLDAVGALTEPVLRSVQ